MRMELEANTNTNTNTNTNSNTNSKKRKSDIFDGGDGHGGDDSVESDKYVNATPYLHKFTPTGDSINSLQPYYILKNLFK